MTEEWRNVPSYPGLMASSFGRVRLPAREYKMPNGGVRMTKPTPTYGVLTAPSKNTSYRRLHIRSRHLGTIKVHRAVCEAFHGLPAREDLIVLHLNEDGTDNRPDNLKWGTRKQNQNAPGFKAWASSVARAKFNGFSGMRKEAK